MSAAAAAQAAPEVATAFRFDRLRKTFRSKDGGDVVALQDVDFRVRRGEFVTVVGPSGCGKSTLLRILAGLERASSGNVELVQFSARSTLRRRASSNALNRFTATHGVFSTISRRLQS